MFMMKTAVIAALAGTALAGVRYAGMNIAGFDFGCLTDGSCDMGRAYNIVDDGNALAQINHFVKDTGFNVFRLPVGWQYLLNNNLGGTLDPTNFGNYRKLVQDCLDSGAALCIIDIHNYARWYGGVIGQGGPTNAQFSSVWSQLAAWYKSEPRIAFGIMNEPHGVDINAWATSVQWAVTGIRQAGATSQLILLPGNDYTSAGSFVSNGSGAALLKVVNLDGSTTNLIFDVHKYLDSDGSGTHAQCVTNNIDSTFAPLATWLRANGRMAFVSETGGGAYDSDCLTLFCQQLQYLNQNSDVYLGYTAWAAGGFDGSYVLTQAPILSGSSMVDVPLCKQCVLGTWKSS